LILFLLFIWALENNVEGHINIPEMTFMVYAFGFALEKVASMQEHGIKVYFTGTYDLTRTAFILLTCNLSGTWNGFDSAFG
jgi:hypothetical protein